MRCLHALGVEVTLYEANADLQLPDALVIVKSCSGSGSNRQDSALRKTYWPVWQSKAGGKACRTSSTSLHMESSMLQSALCRPSPILLEHCLKSALQYPYVMPSMARHLCVKSACGPAVPKKEPVCTSVAILKSKKKCQKVREHADAHPRTWT